MKKLLFALLSTAALGFGMAACSLAGDVTPPPGAASALEQPTITEAPTAEAADPSSNYPIVPPDPSVGAAIYAEKCEPCHGPAGLGDGSMAENLANPVPPIGSVELVRGVRPVDWFTKVTVGAMQRGMPPFRSLNDRQRWDVVAYVYTLSQSSGAQEEGQALFAASCASCHGEEGRGDGPQAGALSSPVIDWTDPSKLAGRSDQELYDILSAGQGDMPAFKENFSADELWSLVSYVRAFSFAPGTLAENGQQPTAESSAAQPTPAAPETVTFLGTVLVSGGASVPAGLVVTLTGYDSMEPGFSATSDVRSDGSFRFEDVPVNGDRVFMATLDYQGITFNSDVVHAADLSGADTPLQITIYETSADASSLSADRLHLIFDLSSENVVYVAEIYLLNNPTDTVIVPAGGNPVLSFSLPKGASNLQFPNMSDPTEFTQTESGFNLNARIPPGSDYQLVYTYELPFNGRAALEMTLPLAVRSPVAMVTSSGIKLNSPQFASAGTRSVQGVNVDLYTSGPLAAGQKVKITLGSGNLTQTLALVLGGVALALIGSGVVLWLRSRKQTEAETEADEDEQPLESEEELLDAIIALDDQLANGEISQEEHTRQRAELKDKLKRLVE